MNIAMIIAGGVGARTGQEIPKQYLTVNEVPIIIYTLRVFQKYDEIEQIVVVTLPEWQGALKAYCRQFGISKLIAVVDAGKTRFESIFNGVQYLRQLAADDDLIVLHDANRPLISGDVLDDSLKVASKYGCALSVLPCNDAMFVSLDGFTANENMDKKILFQGQTPETFKFSIIQDICEKVFKSGGVDLSISALLLAENHEIHLSKGSVKNFKITTSEDIDVFKALLNTPVTKNIRSSK